MIECINERSRDEFQITTSDFNRITPFNKLKTSLLAKIQETYLPEDKPQIADDDEDEIDLTGAKEHQNDM